MGNVEAHDGEMPNSSLPSPQSATSPPPPKRRRLRDSLSLRSLASFASTRLSSRSSTTRSETVDQMDVDWTNTDSSRWRFPFGGKERKNSANGSVLSVERHPPALMDTGFAPDFPWRSDICESDFCIQNSVGRGRFGTVFRAVSRRPLLTADSHPIPQQIALKVQSKMRILADGAEEQIRNEVAVQRSLSPHSFIASFYDSWQTADELFTVMEYVDGFGDLYTLWSDYGQFSEVTVRFYAVEIACGLEFLHANHVIHRDLKMENLALDLNMHIKFVDFGFALALPSTEKASTVCGTLQYMAPEVAKCLPYDGAVDWWSLGILMFLMRTGLLPFGNARVRSHEELRFESRKEFPESCSAEFSDLIKKLLTIDPSERLSNAAAFFSDPFFSPINIDSVYNKEVCPWELLKCEYKFNGDAERLSRAGMFSGAFAENYDLIASFY